MWKEEKQDSADKLESFQPPSKRQRTISLSSSTTGGTEAACHYDDDVVDSNMEVSFVAQGSPQRTSLVGPNGSGRFEIVDILERLGRSLRRVSFARNVHVIKKARVPIVKMKSQFGFEGDVAVGGHSGMDTTQYAANLILRYKR